MRKLNINPLAEIVRKEITNLQLKFKTKTNPKKITIIAHTVHFREKPYEKLAGTVEYLLPGGEIVVQANDENYTNLMKGIAEAINLSDYADCEHSHFNDCDCPEKVIYLHAPKSEPQSFDGTAEMSTYHPI